jgi:hypothetical protein
MAGVCHANGGLNHLGENSPEERRPAWDTPKRFGSLHNYASYPPWLAFSVPKQRLLSH